MVAAGKESLQHVIVVELLPIEAPGEALLLRLEAEVVHEQVQVRVRGKDRHLGPAVVLQIALEVLVKEALLGERTLGLPARN